MANAGSISTTASDGYIDTDGAAFHIQALPWTADSSGAVDYPTPKDISGALVAVGFKPASGGDQPNDLYDAQLIDRYGVNLLDPAGDSNIGDDLSNTTATQRFLTQGGSPAPSLCVADKPRVVISNAGANKKGTLILYSKER